MPEHVFGERDPFILVHEENVKKVVQYLTGRNIRFQQSTVTQRLHKVTFPEKSGDDVRKVLAEMPELPPA